MEGGAQRPAGALLDLYRALSLSHFQEDGVGVATPRLPKSPRNIEISFFLRILAVTGRSISETRG